MSQGFTSEVLGPALVIRFDRLEIRNPLSVRVLDALAVVIADHDALRVLHGIIFTGSADVFASGADLREIAKVTPDGAKEFAERGQALMHSIASFRLRTIAAINGYCFGGGLDLALACDRRIASPNATFAHPGTSLGIITGWGGTQRLPRLVGQANALEMFFTAEQVNAGEALRIGLVDIVADNVLEAALSMVSSSDS